LNDIRSEKESLEYLNLKLQNYQDISKLRMEGAEF